MLFPLIFWNAFIVLKWVNVGTSNLVYSLIMASMCQGMISILQREVHVALSKFSDPLFLNLGSPVYFSAPLIRYFQWLTMRAL